jgi:predicted nucleic-acid-binding Zn-ribbon protein
MNSQLSLAHCSSSSNNSINPSIPLLVSDTATNENQIASSTPSSTITLQQRITQSSPPFKCSKCGCTSYTQGQSLTSGGFLSKILNIQTRKFVTITCNDCGFSEFYERYQNPIANVVDILIR